MGSLRTRHKLDEPSWKFANGKAREQQCGVTGV